MPRPGPGCVMAPVGQVSTQPPHATQSDCAHGPPVPGATTVSAPRPVRVSAKVPCTSSHIRTQRPQAIHRSWSSSMYGWLSSRWPDVFGAAVLGVMPSLRQVSASSLRLPSARACGGRAETMSSMASRRRSHRSCCAVVTFVPGAAGVTQAAVIRPSARTRQVLQDPAGRRRSSWQSVGSSVPATRTASSRDAPSRTSTGRPSTRSRVIGPSPSGPARRRVPGCGRQRAPGARTRTCSPRP